MRALPSNCRQRGISFFEVVISIAVLGVLTSIIIPMATNIVPASRDTAATANLEELNAALMKFNHANWELMLVPNASSSDEEAIFRSLQYRDNSSPAPGAPYIDANNSFVATSNIETYRAQWNGRTFQLLTPGTAGTGMNLLEMTGNTSPATFSSNYRPVGARR